MVIIRICRKFQFYKSKFKILKMNVNYRNQKLIKIIEIPMIKILS